jgi:SpoVK/Ycf46/Vps4 family AAA+-type ATPase
LRKHSEYKGKCIKIKLRENRFRGIEIIDMESSSNELILTDVQHKFINHFISRVSRGGNARYLLNGEPGTGKTEAIREIARKLIPLVTFVIPDFTTSDDLTSIMEACEIFENGVIVMDDIDLYLGSRDNGSYTRLLGQFLSFFDGVKKRKISLLASTNDKGLVDKAAERPGRFNFTLDYSFLNQDQIVKVCKIHLDEEWQLPEVYAALTGKVNGKKVNITGAFIANLADNIREMAEDDEEWSVEDTISLITESYKGFYSSQVDKENTSMGFQTK